MLRRAEGCSWWCVLRARFPSLQKDNDLVIFSTAVQLGQRLGELVSLTWDRVDLHRGIITLRSIDTKTKKPRQVPLTLPVRQALVELSKVRDLGHRHVFVYHRSPVQEVKTAFRTACRRAGIENLRFHDRRHCAATNLKRAGVHTTTACRSLATNPLTCGSVITRWLTVT